MMKTVFISGLGLIGSSLARVISKNGNYVIGFDPKIDNTNFMLRNKFINASLDFNTAAIQADVIILAGPVNVIIEQINKLNQLNLKPGTIISDVGSTKASIMKAASVFKAKQIYFIGGHPMAGSQLTGSQAGKLSLFKNATYFMVPSESAKDKVCELEEILAKSEANFKTISPNKHDQIVGNISHLPHAIAFTLMNTIDQTIGKELQDINVGGGLLSTTRIAAADAEMWNAIFQDNSQNILHSINEFETELKSLKKMIKNNDTNKLKHFMQHSQMIRKQIEKK
ncbi:prephenate dehydrogenase [Apilactobacillus timberlakei]|nr:prephenate dehydrogenase [Apilactobacillus timberlakei]